MIKVNRYTWFILFVLAVLPLFFLSCRENKEINALMQEAEAVMENKPDSAYQLLLQADKIGTFSRDQRALWNLRVT